MFDKNSPYNDLPLLPPKVEIETKEVLKKNVTASRALAHLNGAIRNLPNPRLFLDTLHLQEARASSEIENIITTNDLLYKSLVSNKSEGNTATKEVISYKEAIWLALNQLESRPFITTNLCIEIVQCIKRNDLGIRKTVGTTLANKKGEIIYTPPSGEEVIRNKMANLEDFINSDSSLDPLIKMAVIHYQFEAIHPFLDGNGRAGRILILIYLKLEKLLDIPVIFFSQYIIEHKSKYYRAIREVTEHNRWVDFILYMLDMIEESANRDLRRLNTIVSAMETVGKKIQAKVPFIYSKDLLESIFHLPYVKRQTLVDVGLGNAKTAGNYLSLLEKEGFLKSVKVGREKLYLNETLMNILELMNAN